MDDILFGGNDGMGKKFVCEMQKEFEMPMIIGELNFFLGLQVNQNNKAIFGLENSKSICNLTTIRCKLTNDGKSPKPNARKCRSMIGGVLYLTATRPDSIIFK